MKNRNVLNLTPVSYVTYEIADTSNGGFNLDKKPTS